MMMDSWQFLLVFSAVAVGWMVGRYNLLSTGDNTGQISRQYYKGLNYLLNDQPDDELDSFISSLDVNAETLDTHLAVGNLMRRKGEVDRAIRIHQNVLARPNLPREHLQQAHLELARDYISAGLWDRAERLLKDLLEDAPEIRSICKRHLMEIYQDEKEWKKALDIAKQLLPKRSLLKYSTIQSGQIAVSLSHYCCELAELDIAENNYFSARSYLKQALNYDSTCVRASMLAADIEYYLGHYPLAIKQLKKVVDQDPIFVSEIVDKLQRCYSQLDDEESYLKYLSGCLDRYPSVALLLTLADNIESTRGEMAASEYLGEALKKRPSLRGLAKLVELNINEKNDQTNDSLVILQLLIKQLMSNKPQYQCHNCGFSGKQLHWFCPSCKQWGKIKAIRGAEGD